jgi:hypothetical protein
MNPETEERLSRSSCINSTLSFLVASLTSSTTAWPFEGVLEATITCAFFFASSCTQTLPIYMINLVCQMMKLYRSTHELTPVLPPVTMQTFPVISGISSSVKFLPILAVDIFFSYFLNYSLSTKYGFLNEWWRNQLPKIMLTRSM